MVRWQRTEKGKHDLSRRHRSSTEMALVCTQLNIVSLLIIAAAPHSTGEGRRKDTYSLGKISYMYNTPPCTHSNQVASAAERSLRQGVPRLLFPIFHVRKALTQIRS